MNADEIVRALREDADWCDANEYEIPLCMGDNQREAADLIESLQAQLSKLEKKIAAEGFSDLETMISKYKTVMLAANELSIETDEELEELRAQLSESQRREKAARNELCLKCGLYHDAHNGACDGCRWKEK